MNADDRPPMGLPMPDPSGKGFAGVNRPYAHQFGGWRGTVVAAALVAAMAVGYLVGQAGAPPPEAEAVAILVDADGVAGAIVEAYANRSVRVVPLAAIDVPEGRTLRLWAGPVPLGFLPGAGETLLHGADVPASGAEDAYRITLEDATRSTPAAAPGPELLSGVAVRPPR